MAIATSPDVDMSPAALSMMVTEHYFADGMYARKVTRPAGFVIVGKVHKREHFYVVAKGSVLVVNGEERSHLKAGDLIVSKPGTKRNVFALEDSVCVTFHRTAKRNLKEIEKELLEHDETAVFDECNNLVFDAKAFRALTADVIAAEKFGFWSDWTEEQRALYSSGDWLGFSASRGYSSEEIETYGRWLECIRDAQSKGIDPYPFIGDLALEAAVRNIALDSKGEIMKSSHLPFQARTV